ncbi:MAG: PEGA domain-containing protein [Candidatus Cloacimonadaceae bacterium]|nr:PEGA domain-containing protein [Candidatus Cloacimonadaceae bacterium]
MKLRIACIALLVMASLMLNAQTRLKRFEVVPKPTPVTNLQVDHPDCAVVIVHSAIPNLHFESNMGKIKAQEYRHLESRYVIFLYPEKQRVSIKSPGFVEAEFPMFSDLKPRQQFSYEINEAFDTTGKGNFTLQSDPPGADITIEQIPIFNEKTPYHFEQFGAQSYGIRLSKDRYEPLSANILIEANKTQSQTLKLVPQWADLIINSEPTGSSVYVNNALKGTTPLSLSGVSSGLDPGDYTIELRPASQFYESFTQRISLRGNSKEELKHAHKDISGYLRVNISPQPLEVRLNDTINRTLALGERIRLLSGNYNIEVINVGENRQYYKPHTESFTLKPLEEKLITLILPDDSGIINIAPSHLPVQLYLDNKKDTDLTENLNKRLISGTYSLKAVYTGDHKNAFEPIEQSIQLKAADNLNIPLEFNPRRQRLMITANVDDYKLSIMDRESGVSTDYDKPNQIPALYVGAYGLRAEKPGYRVVRHEINILDRDIALQIKLEKLSNIYSHRIGKWRTNKYVAASTVIATLGATAYFGYDCMQNYNNYQSATTSSAAKGYRLQTIDSRNNAYTSIGANILGCGWMLYSAHKQKHWQNKLQSEMER